MVVKTPAFEKAIVESRKLKAKPDQDALLELYALFKQGNQDPPFNPADKPSVFNLKEKYKFAAWEKLVKDKVTPEDAQKQYVALVEKLKGIHGYEA